MCDLICANYQFEPADERCGPAQPGKRSQSGAKYDGDLARKVARPIESAGQLVFQAGQARTLGLRKLFLLQCDAMRSGAMQHTIASIEPGILRPHLFGWLELSGLCNLTFPLPAELIWKFSNLIQNDSIIGRAKPNRTEHSRAAAAYLACILAGSDSRLSSRAALNENRQYYYLY